MERDLPSMTALQAFDATLRHRSFSRAAAELHRTQGAISRQVAALEQQVGASLFVREHPRIRPTAAAERFGAKVRGALDRLDAAVREIQAQSETGGFIRLALLPTFGTRWLIPRYRALQQALPDLTLDLTTRLLPFDFDVEDIDAAIHYGLASWPGARLDHLLDETVVPVCAPSHPAATAHIPADIGGQPLLQLASRPRAWTEWFEHHGVTGIATRRGPRFEHHTMVIQAAIAGLGVALIPGFFVADELRAGTLALPPGIEPVTTGRSYWLAFPERSRHMPALEALERWLLDQLAREGLRRPSTQEN